MEISLLGLVFFILGSVYFLISFLLRRTPKQETRTTVVDLFLTKLQLGVSRVVRVEQFYAFTGKDGQEYLLLPKSSQEGRFVTYGKAQSWKGELFAQFGAAFRRVIVTNEDVSLQIEDQFRQWGIEIFSIQTEEDVERVLSTLVGSVGVS